MSSYHYSFSGCLGLALEAYCSRRLSKRSPRCCALPGSDTYLERSRHLAGLRAKHTSSDKYHPNIFEDRFAEGLSSAFNVNVEPSNVLKSDEDAFDLIATKFVDDGILTASNMVNVNKDQEYRQIVLIGDGMCTRFCRLPLPRGMVIFLVAPGQVNERAEAFLQAQGAKVAPGCLLKRVDHDFDQDESSFLQSLEKNGFRGDRLSIWALQGIRSMSLSKDKFSSILMDISNAAAFESIILGETPPFSEQQLENILAAFGIVGGAISLEQAVQRCFPNFDNASDSWWSPGASRFGEANVKPQLFRANQRRFSLAEMNLYDSHVQAAEEVDEDFFGNFS